MFTVENAMSYGPRESTKMLFCNFFMTNICPHALPLAPQEKKSSAAHGPEGDN